MMRAVSLARSGGGGLAIFVRRTALCTAGGLVLTAFGGEGVRLNPKLVAGGDVDLSAFTPDGKRVIYVADQEVDERRGLYRVPADGSQQALPLTDLLLPGRAFDALLVSPDGERVVYRADQDTDEQFELYSVPTDGSGTSVKISLGLTPVADVHRFVIPADGRRVVYSVAGPVPWRVFSAPIDGSQPPVSLAAIFDEFQVTGDGTRVVFRGGGAHFFSTPVGGGDLTHLQPSPLDEIPTADWRLTADGQRVVYRGLVFFDTTPLPAYVICSVPLDGSAPALPLFSPIQEGKHPSSPEFQVSPDSRWVVHRTDPAYPLTAPRDLLSAPIDGSAPPVRLTPGNPSIPSPGVVSEFRITPDGARVVYLYPPWLFSVPIDRSRPPRLLSEGLSARGPLSVSSQGRAVFSCLVGGHVELFSVPVDGSAAPVQLSGPQVAGGNLSAHWLSPDGRLVAYKADQDVDQRFELYVAPVDGSRPSRRINGTLVSGGSVAVPLFRPDSRAVMYGADQEQDGVFEIFATWIDGRRVHGASR